MSGYCTWQRYDFEGIKELTGQACYDPEEGPKVWQRMTQMAKGQPRIPRFLSTHPENKDREERLESHMDEVALFRNLSNVQAIRKGVEAGCGSGYGDFQRKVRDGMW